ncbi:MAG: putative eliminase [Rhodospirillaceae bacterium]|nr:MAG: putative eliminase [Rhodospirillaceae bacterium]
MTVGTISTSSPTYNGTGAVTSFPFSFKAYDPDHVVVILTDPDGRAVRCERNAHYTVTLASEGAGGTVTFITAPAAKYTVLIKRDVPALQETVLRNQGSMFPTDVERMVDLVVMHDQQQDEAIAQCRQSLSPDTAKKAARETMDAIRRMLSDCSERLTDSIQDTDQWSIQKMSERERKALLPDPAELIFDTDLKTLFVGDGKTVGGVALLTGQTGIGVSGPASSTDYALALFDGTDGKRLRSGPSAGADGTALLGKGLNKAPVFDRLPLASLLPPEGTESDHVVIFGKDGQFGTRRLSPSSLARAERGKVLTGNGINTGDGSNVADPPPSFQDPFLGTLVQIGTCQRVINSSVDAVEVEGINDKYDLYILVGTGIKPNETAGSSLEIRFKDKNGIIKASAAPGRTDLSSIYLIEGYGKPRKETTTSITVEAVSIGGITKHCGTFMLKMFYPGSSSLYTQFIIDQISAYVNDSKDHSVFNTRGGCMINEAAVSGVQIKFARGRIVGGTFSLYGLERGTRVQSL